MLLKKTTLILLTIFGISSCTAPVKRPAILWYKNSVKDQGIIGPKEGPFKKRKIIKYWHDAYNDFLSIHKDDFKKLLQYTIENEQGFLYLEK